MDGKSPSGFINSTYCGMNCKSRAPSGIFKPYIPRNYTDDYNKKKETTTMTKTNTTTTTQLLIMTIYLQIKFR